MTRKVIPSKPKPTPTLALDALVTAVCEVCDVANDVLVSRALCDQLSRSRQILATLARKHGHTTADIAALLHRSRDNVQGMIEIGRAKVDLNELYAHAARSVENRAIYLAELKPDERPIPPLVVRFAEPRVRSKQVREERNRAKRLAEVGSGEITKDWYRANDEKFRAAMRKVYGAEGGAAA